MLHKLNTLLKNSLIYSLSGFTGRFIGIFLVPVYTRIFSPYEYGVIDMIVTVTAILNLFLILSLDSAVGRYYVDSESDQDKRLTASTSLFFLIAFSLPVVLLLMAFSKEITVLVFGTKIYSTYLTIALATIPFSILFSSFLDLLKWRLQPVTYATISIVSMLFQISLVIYLVVFLRIGIIGIFITNLVATIVFSAIGFYLTRSSYSLVFSCTRLKELLFYGVPMVSLSLTHYIMTFSDRYFLKHFWDLTEVGLYGIGYKLASLINLLVFGFLSAWGPFVYSTYKDKEAKLLFSKIYDYTSIVICLAILILSLFAKEILILLTTQDYVKAYTVVPFISASIAAYTLGGYFSFGVGIAKKTFHKAWGGGIAALINLGLNYILIPSMGMIGAAISTIISFLVLGVILMSISQRYYHVEYKFGANFIMYFITALIILIAYRIFPSGLTFESITLKFLLLIIFLGVPFLLKLISSEETRHLKNMLLRAIGSITKYEVKN